MLAVCQITRLRKPADLRSAAFAGRTDCIHSFTPHCIRRATLPARPALLGRLVPAAWTWYQPGPQRASLEGMTSSEARKIVANLGRQDFERTSDRNPRLDGETLVSRYRAEAEVSGDLAIVEAIDLLDDPGEAYERGYSAAVFDQMVGEASR